MGHTNPQRQAEGTKMTASNHHGSPSGRPETESLPHSIEAEQAVIGSLLLDNAAWTKVEGLINDQDFYRDDHRLIFRHIVALLENGGVADIVMVFDLIQNANEVEQTGGLEYLAEIMRFTPSGDRIQHYMEIMREKSHRRSIFRFCDDLATEAMNGGHRSAQTLLDNAECHAYRMQTDHFRTPRRRLSLASALDQAMNRVRALSECNNKDALTGIASGYIDLDRLTSGFQRGDLVVVAGRPGMKKTELVLNIAEHVGVDLGLPVLILTHDVPAQQLAVRAIASRARVDLGKLQSGRLTADDEEKLGKGLERLRDTKIFIDDSGRITQSEFRSQLRRTHRECNGLGLIIVYDIEMIGSPRSSRKKERSRELVAISHELKRLAEELVVPIIVCSSLSRVIDKRTDKRPMLSDLREFCPVDQDADLVLLLYQDDFYVKASADPGMTELRIGKHRNGPLGVVRLAFNREYCRFESAPCMGSV
jgi:replicative DNA helicase